MTSAPKLLGVILRVLVERDGIAARDAADEALPEGIVELFAFRPFTGRSTGRSTSGIIERWIVRTADFRGTTRFAIQRRIGAGGFGVVYAARDTERDSVVALKTLKHLTPESLYRFKREFRSLADINHPNLVQLYELFSESDEWFFTMELVSGCTFAEYAWLRDAGSAPATMLMRSSGSDVTEPALMDALNVASTPNQEEVIPQVPIGTAADPARLTAALRQLVEGVSALHRAGNIHRDLKPANVLVTPEERVVVLDFGLLVDLDSEATLQSMQVAGTPAYMSPEQAAGLPLSWATDWYSVGIMLYEALTGQLPFSGKSYLEVLHAKQQKEPPPPSRLVTGVPPHLDTLCRDLLRRDVANRPGADEILERLADTEWRAAKAKQVRARPTGRALFVGREKHLFALRKAMDDAASTTVTVCLSGLSGMGKSSLVRTFLDRWREEHPDTVILTGRCYERESVPYKALDSFIDSLARYLRRLPDLEMESMLPRDALALTQLFPVLRQLEDRLPARRRMPVVPDAQELRRRAFAALREMMARVADRRPTIIFVDDLQWGDIDSADLLRETLRSPDSPPLLFIAAYRSDEVRTSPFLRTFLTPENTEVLNMREVRVEQLTADESRHLAAALLDQNTPRLGNIARAIAAEAGGSPFFIDELVRSAAVEPVASVEAGTLDSDAREMSLAQMIQLRVARLPHEARELLELIAVNGQPIPVQVLKRAAAVESQESPLALLNVEHFIRTRETEKQDELETYHDRIREAVVRSLSPETERRLHKVLAIAFESVRGSDAEILAEHFFAAGDEERAIEYTIQAADNAERVLAFDRAAALYRRVLDLLPSNSTKISAIRTSLGDALVNAGRGAEAAQVFLSIEGVGFAERLNLRQRAAQQYLFSGHIDEGLSVFGDVLQSVGLTLPDAWWRTILSFLIGRARVRLRGLRFRERDEGSIPPDTLRRIDTCRAVAIGLGNVDTVRGAVFQAFNFVWALDAGEVHRVAHAFSLEAAYSSIDGTRSQKRTQRVLECAEQVTARADTPYAKAFLALCSGVVAQLQGRWRHAIEQTGNAERIFRDNCKAVAWEIDSSWFYNLESSYFHGDLRAIVNRYPALLKDASDRGDLFASTSLRVRLGSYASLAGDDPARALRDVQDGMSRWSQSGFTIQHMWEFSSTIDIALYEGRGTLAWTRINHTWPALRVSTILHIQFTRINAFDQRGKSALAASESIEFPAQRERFLKEAENSARRIDREKAGWASGLASFLRIGVKVRRGKVQEAIRDLAELEQTFARLDMPLHAAVALRRRGELMGGGEGDALRALSDEWMREQNIANPDRFSYVIVPWRASDPRG